MLALAVVGGAGAAFFASAPRADALPEKGDLVDKKGRSFRLTVMGTTDLHGNALNWDYFKDAEYDDTAHNDIGLAKVVDPGERRSAPSVARPHAAARRRRHHPGHAAGVLLRQGRADHRRRRSTRWPPR